MKERDRILSVLSRTPAMGPEHHNFQHGRLKHYPPNSGPKVRDSIVQYSTVQYFTLLYFTVLYCAVLYCIQ